MRELIDLTGQRFGRLVVLERGDNYVCETLHPDGSSVVYKAPKWRCRCDCGNEVTVLGASLKTGNTKSCGCYRKERTRHENQTRSRRSDADQSA